MARRHYTAQPFVWGSRSCSQHPSGISRWLVPDVSGWTWKDLAYASGCWRAIVLSTAKASAPPVLTRTIVTVDIRLIRRGKITVRFWIEVLYHRICPSGTWGSHWDHALRRKCFFHNFLLANYSLILHNPVLVHYALLGRSLFNLYSDGLSHSYR